MTEQNELQHSLHPKSLGKRKLQGAGIALVLLTIFLLMLIVIGGDIDLVGVWVMLPLITATVAGALGGIFYYLMDHLRYAAQRNAAQRYQGGWKKVLADISCILVYIMLLWISLIAAFSATGHWD